MINFVLNGGKQLSITKRCPIFVSENKADTLNFTVDPLYGNIDLASCVCTMHWINQDGVGNSAILAMNDDPVYDGRIFGSYEVTTDFTYKIGTVKLWLEFTNADALVLKTSEALINISAHDNVSELVPSTSLELLEQWEIAMAQTYANMQEVAQGVVDDAAAAAQSRADAESAKAVVESVVAHTPIIGENRNWFTWDFTSGEYIDTGYTSSGIDGTDGQDGFSPTISIEKIGAVSTITITDANGTIRSTVADGENGHAGPRGEQGVKGDKGDQGEVGPQGEKGDTGPKGDTGVAGSPGQDGIDALVLNIPIYATIIPTIDNTYDVSIDHFNRIPVIDNTYVAIMSGKDDMLGRSWITLCKIVSVSDGNVGVQIKCVVETTGIQGPQGLKGDSGESSVYIGNEAPTIATVAPSVGTLYVDAVALKTYQCVAINDGAYIWEQLIRSTDYAGSGINGVVNVNQSYGVFANNSGRLYICQATEDDISNGVSFKPITPANLNYAVRSVRPIATATIDNICVNTIYDLGEQAVLTLDLPTGQLGDFIQVDFLCGETPTALTIIATSSALSDCELIPEANKIYSLFFIYGRLDTLLYGWKIAYIENIRMVV